MGFGIGILTFTGACLIFGALLGALRGQNRSILRLILVIACAVVAFFLRETFTDMILGIDVGGKTLLDSLNESLLSGAAIPEQIAGFITTIVEILIGTIVFIVVFAVLKFASWLILFQLLKIVVRPAKDNKKGGIGLVFGLVQGLIVAFLFCVPLTGFMGQFAKIADTLIDITLGTEEASIENLESKNTLLSADGSEYAIQDIIGGIGNPGEEINPDEIESTAKEMLAESLKQITQSPVVKFYNSIGGWYFDALTTVKNDQGQKVNIDSTTDVLVVMVSLTTDVFDIEEEIGELMNNDAEPTEVLAGIGEILINVSDNIDMLDENGAQIFDQLLDGVKELIVPEGTELSPEIEKALDNLNYENLNLRSAGEAFMALSDYAENIENPEVTENITLDGAKTIVNAINDNPFIMEMIGDTVVINVEKEDKEVFKTAVESIENISAEDKQALLKMFGVSK